MKRTVFTSVLLGVFCAVAAIAATPPTLINYQGVLRNASDAPQSGTCDLVFRFFDAASLGNEILVDSHTSGGANAVSVSGGLFNAQLGGGTLTDGSGAGSYTSLADAFRDYGTVTLDPSASKALYDAINAGVDRPTPATDVATSQANPTVMPLAPREMTPSPGTPSSSKGELPAIDRSVEPTLLRPGNFVRVTEPVETGDVLVVDHENPGAMRLGSVASDSTAIGIVAATGPGTSLGPGEAPVALAGSVVFCKVDASYGAIRLGDLLSVSPTSGHAMRSSEPAPGTVVGKALESLDSGTGLIRVLVMSR